MNGVLTRCPDTRCCVYGSILLPCTPRQLLYNKTACFKTVALQTWLSRPRSTFCSEHSLLISFRAATIILCLTSLRVLTLLIAHAREGLNRTR